jgi:hypothetical protein
LSSSKKGLTLVFHDSGASRDSVLTLSVSISFFQDLREDMVSDSMYVKLGHNERIEQLGWLVSYIGDHLFHIENHLFRSTHD